MRKCWYTIALIYSLALAIIVNVVPGLVKDVMAMQGKVLPADEKEQESGGTGDKEKWTAGQGIGEGTDMPECAVEIGGEADGEAKAPRPAGTSSEAETVQGNEADSAGTDITGGGYATDAEPSFQNKQSTAGEQKSPPTDENFQGALFIGDSRTVGLSEYGSLGDAAVFADTGMSVFNLFDAQVSDGKGGSHTLDQVLSQNVYQSIYLMLGINELGYRSWELVERYEAVVDKIQALQPGAAIILEANLHVTQEKSDQSPIYNNQNINTLNLEIKRIADDKACFYLDVNEIFDDGNGNLDSAFSTDGSHVLGKYYAVWGDWLKAGGS